MASLAGFFTKSILNDKVSNQLNLLLLVFGSWDPHVLDSKTSTDEEASCMSSEIKLLILKVLQERKEKQHEEENQKLVPEWTESLEV
jgi:hypothetical protein